jgi:peptide/nickel transport system permease protein
VLGADELGRDLLSRLILGARVSLMVGFIATSISLLFGVVLGAISGYVGGWVDDVIMRIMDVLLALPGHPAGDRDRRGAGPQHRQRDARDRGGAHPDIARVVRSDVLAIREEEFVEAVKALGQNHVVVLFKHILMNAWAPTLVLATLGHGHRHRGRGGALVPRPGGAAAADLLGPDALGRPRGDAQRPHVTLYPGIAITIVVLGFSLLGDGLRDVFDRRLKDN